jgi:hypothetical protein
MNGGLSRINQCLPISGVAQGWKIGKTWSSVEVFEIRTHAQGGVVHIARQDLRISERMRSSLRVIPKSLCLMMQSIEESVVGEVALCCS